MNTATTTEPSPLDRLKQVSTAVPELQGAKESTDAFHEENQKKFRDAEDVFGAVVIDSETSNKTGIEDRILMYAYARAVNDVNSGESSIIQQILAVGKKHKLVGSETVGPKGAFKIEIGTPLVSHNASATDTLLTLYPNNTGNLLRWYQAFVQRPSEITARNLNEGIDEFSGPWRQAFVHELTHVVQNKIYQNDSYPWFSFTNKCKINEMSDQDPRKKALVDLDRLEDPGVVQKAVAELERVGEPYVRKSKRYSLDETETILARFSAYAEKSGASEVIAHLAELVQREGEKYVQDELPRGYELLKAFADRIPKYIELGSLPDFIEPKD